MRRSAECFPRAWTPRSRNSGTTGSRKLARQRPSATGRQHGATGSSQQWSGEARLAMQKLSFDPTIHVARATAPLPATMPAARPKLVDREADFDLPRRLWDNWTPAQGTRAIVRALTEPERATLQRRHIELSRGLTPFSHDEFDQVRAPLHAMLSGFRSLRESGEDAETSVEVLLAVLRDFPVWAIEDACLRIAQRDIDVDPPIDPRWAPSNGQIHAAVAAIVRPYAKAHASARALLDSPAPPPRAAARPSRAEIEAKLGRAIGERRASFTDDNDGKHAQRVMEDLERRRAKAASAA